MTTYANEPDLVNSNEANASNQEKSSEVISAEPVPDQSKLKGRAIMLDLNSDRLEYIQEDDQFIATGSAEIYIPEQDARLEAQKIIYDQAQQLLFAENKVKITKNGKVIYGEFVRIDLTKESVLVTDPNTEIYKIKMTAESAIIYPENIEASNGKITINNQDLNNLLLSSETPTSSKYYYDEQEELKNQAINIDDGNRTYKITAKEIIVDSKPDMNVIRVKNAGVWIKNIKVATIPSLTLNTDKDISRIESQLPEIGHNRQMGTYLGPSHVFNLLKGSTLKVAPVIAFGDGIGAGAIARFTSKLNKTMVGCTSNKEKLVVEGEHILLSPNTKFIYSSNSYVDDGVLGLSMPKYLFEIVDERKLASAFNFDFYSRLSAGYAADYASARYYDENEINYLESKNDFGTARFKLQGNLVNNEPIFKIKDRLLQFRVHSQFDISVYGTGDTVGLLRGGPRLDSKIGPVRLSSTYLQSGMFGETPFIFDRYVYGKSNLVMLGDIKVNKYLSVGHIRSLNLSKDNWQKQLSVENQIYARVGPEDIKFRIGYDFVRNRSTFDVALLLGSGKTGIDFEKLRINEIK
jgi:hypothetical protein